MGVRLWPEDVTALTSPVPIDAVAGERYAAAQTDPLGQRKESGAMRMQIRGFDRDICDVVHDLSDVRSTRYRDSPTLAT